MRNLQTELPEHTFRLKTYKKNELAMMYFPDVTKDAASRNFRRWIRQCPPMMKKLQAMGYDKNRQYLLKAEVEVIDSQTPGRTVLAGFTGCFFHCFSPV